MFKSAMLSSKVYFKITAKMTMILATLVSSIIVIDLLSLKHRLFLFNVLFFFKVLNGYFGIDISSAVQFYSDTATYPSREKDGLTLKKNYASTNTFKFSFLIVLLICGIYSHFQLDQCLVSQVVSLT